MLVFSYPIGQGIMHVLVYRFLLAAIILWGCVYIENKGDWERGWVMYLSM